MGVVVDDPLEFIRNGRTGLVHVAAQDEGMRARAWERFLALYGLKPPQPVMALVHGPAVSLCGWVGQTSPAFDDEYTSVFPDEYLCGKCFKLLGDQSHLAFEHAQVEDDER